MRTGAPEFVEGGRTRLADGVVGRVLPPTPSVQDHEHHGAAFLHRGTPFNEPVMQEGSMPRLSGSSGRHAPEIARSAPVPPRSAEVGCISPADPSATAS